MSSALYSRVTLFVIGTALGISSSNAICATILLTAACRCVCSLLGDPAAIAVTLERAQQEVAIAISASLPYARFVLGFRAFVHSSAVCCSCARVYVPPCSRHSLPNVARARALCVLHALAVGCCTLEARSSHICYHASDSLLCCDGRRFKTNVLWKKMKSEVRFSVLFVSCSCFRAQADPRVLTLLLFETNRRRSMTQSTLLCLRSWWPHPVIASRLSSAAHRSAFHPVLVRRLLAGSFSFGVRLCLLRSVGAFARRGFRSRRRQQSIGEFLLLDCCLNGACFLSTPLRRHIQSCFVAFRRRAVNR